MARLQDSHARSILYSISKLFQNLAPDKEDQFKNGVAQGELQLFGSFFGVKVKKETNLRVHKNISFAVYKFLEQS